MVDIRPLLERINALQDQVATLQKENQQLKAGRGRGSAAPSSAGGADQAVMQRVLKQAAQAEKVISQLRARLDKLEKAGKSGGGAKPAAPSGKKQKGGKGPRRPVLAPGEGTAASTLSAEEKFLLIKSIGEEVNEVKELKELMASKKPQIVAYDGFEPSGRMHIAQGLIRAINVNKFLDSGVTFKFWVADWFALMNRKLGGDLKKIKKAGELMIETWRACGLKVDHPNLKFLWSSDEINADADRYWSLVLDIATKFNLTRIKKCTQIMGRKESDELSASQIFYPVMQTADIFFLGVDICSLGVDQRKVNMLAREYCTKSKRKFKPVIVSHHMLAGLNGEKMSKSNPDSAIFMDDQPQDVKRKINKAFCEEGNLEVCPVLEYVEYIVFPQDGQFTIKRKADYGGDKTYKSFPEVKADFGAKQLHPGDLKKAVILCINRYLAPVLMHFKKNAKAKALLKQVKGFKITR